MDPYQAPASDVSDGSSDRRPTSRRLRVLPIVVSVVVCNLFAVVLFVPVLFAFVLANDPSGESMPRVLEEMELGLLPRPLNVWFVAFSPLGSTFLAGWLAASWAGEPRSHYGAWAGIVTVIASLLPELFEPSGVSSYGWRILLVAVSLGMVGGRLGCDRH